MPQLKDIDLLKVGHTIHLAGAVYIGEGKAYLVMLPEYQGSISAFPDETVGFNDDKTGHHSVDTLDLSREDWTTFLRQTDLLETEALERAGEDKKLVKAIIRKSQRQTSQDVSWRVFRRDNFKCRYCGADDCPLTVDHLVLWEEGGPTEEENLLSSCKRCNNRRGSLPYAEWLQDPYYMKMARNLSAEVRQANEDIIKTLDSIPKLKHRRSSR